MILKESLIKQNEENNCTSIDFDYLYENNLRYNLELNIWNLEIIQ